MTDITDQDRRDMIGWADDAIAQGDASSPRARTVAHYVKATVDAPAPTLAEELRSWAEDASYDEDRDNLLHAADRAEQIEEERDEARKRATANLRAVDAVRAQRDEASAEVESLAEERDRAQYTLAEVTNARDSLREAYDHARAEVDRLTAENEDLRRNRPNGHDPFLILPCTHTVQKGAESNAESIDPADVPAGEAWLIGRPGAPGIGVRNCPHTDFPWTVVEDEGHVRVMDSGIVLRSRLVPAPRVITNPDELEQLAATSIIRDGRGWPGGITDQGVTMINGFCVSDEEVLGHGPVTVLWEPEA